jgi:hypothetical protein
VPLAPDPWLVSPDALPVALAPEEPLASPLETEEVEPAAPVALPVMPTSLTPAVAPSPEVVPAAVAPEEAPPLAAAVLPLPLPSEDADEHPASMTRT